MTFKRPQGIKFTDMAKWVDSCAYSPDRDNNKFVEYLYHIAYIKAEKAALFTDYTQYDDFALFCVSKFLIRYSNTVEAPVKSIVNYLKTVLSYWKAEYVREFCCGDADLSIADFNLSDFDDYLIDAASEFDYNSYNYLCFRVADAARKHLQRIPRKKDSAEWDNIYTSCLLTLEKQFKAAVEVYVKARRNKEILHLSRALRELRKLPPVLFHVSEENSTYVSVLVNELIHAISAELTKEAHYPVSPSTCLKNLVKAACNDEDEN